MDDFNWEEILDSEMRGVIIAEIFDSLFETIIKDSI